MIRALLVLLSLAMSASALELTHFGYANDPNHDSKSSKGIGAFSWDDTPGALNAINATGVTAVALSPDVVAQYGLKPGQQFTVVAGGVTYTLEYADNTDPSLTGRVDLFDPAGTFTASGAQVTSVQGGPVFSTPQPGVGAVAAAVVSMNIIDPLLQKFQSMGANRAISIRRAAMWLFWTLALINLVWMGGMMVLRRAELLEITAELIRYIMVTGLFFWFLANGPVFAQAIVKSLWMIGGQASGNGMAIFPGDVVSLGLSVLNNTLHHVNFFLAESVVAPVLIAIGIMLVCAMITANMVILLCGAWIVLYAGMIFLGFGGCRWTSDMAINYFRTMVGVGASLLTMELIIGIGIKFLQDLVAATTEAPTASALASVLCAAVILALIAHRVPTMVSNIAIGSGHNGSIGAMGVLGMMGAWSMISGLAGRMTGGADRVDAGIRSAVAPAIDSIRSRISGADGNGSQSTSARTSPVGSNSIPPPRQNVSSQGSQTTQHSERGGASNAVTAVEPPETRQISPDEQRGVMPPGDYIYPDEP